jgi:hypothetical protein
MGPWVQCYETFYVCNIRMSVLSLEYLSLTGLSSVWVRPVAYLRVEAPERCLTLVGSGLTHKH